MHLHSVASLEMCGVRFPEFVFVINIGVNSGVTKTREKGKVKEQKRGIKRINDVNNPTDLRSFRLAMNV